jgi:hypothetical protein
MYAEYRRRCKAQPREFNLGDAFLWKAEGKPALKTSRTRGGGSGTGIGGGSQHRLLPAVSRRFVPTPEVLLGPSSHR